MSVSIFASFKTFLIQPEIILEQLPYIVFENSITIGIFQAFCLLSYQDTYLKFQLHITGNLQGNQ